MILLVFSFQYDPSRRRTYGKDHIQFNLYMMMQAGHNNRIPAMQEGAKR